jgi:chromate transporter
VIGRGRRVAREIRPEKEVAAREPIRFRRYFGYFLGLGTWGFGGPIATVGYMQRDLVEGRGWITRQDFLDGVALGQTMPGPLAAQVAMWVGYLQAGAVGALGTAVPFILPSLAIVLGVAYLYVRFEGLTVVQSLFYGIAPAVMAVIAFAAVKLARLTNARDLRLWGISAVIMAVTALTGAEIAVLFLAAGVAMVPLGRSTYFPEPGRLGLRVRGGPALQRAHRDGHRRDPGGARPVLPQGWRVHLRKRPRHRAFLREGVVNQHHWLTERQFLDAVAIGLITPGPVVITAAFIGYLVGGLAGAGVATLAIFTPIYLGVVIPGRWFIRQRENPQIRAFVKGATAPRREPSGERPSC